MNKKSPLYLITILNIRARVDSCKHCGGSGKTFNRNITGELLRDARLDHKLTLTEVAKRIHLTKSYLSDLEHGRREWSTRLIQMVIDAITETSNYLI